MSTIAPDSAGRVDGPVVIDGDFGPRAVGDDERRAGDPVNALGRALGSVTTTAVDAYEIASAIEARGINDATARSQYGCDDVFALAEEIYRRSPLHPQRRRVKYEYDPLGRRRILRGVLFALPGLLFFPLARLVDIHSAAVVFVAVTLLGWIASQGVSSLAHLQATRVGRPAMAAVLRFSLVMGVSATVGAAAGARFAGQNDAIIIAASAQLVYLLSAIVLLTLDRDKELALVLVPATVIVGLLMALPTPQRAAALVVVAAAAAAAAAAFRATRGSRWAGLHRQDVGRSLVMAVYGCLLGLLIASPIIARLIDDTHVTMWLGAAALPVTLSMGFAERRFVEMRIANREDLQKAHQPHLYSRRAFRRFVRALSAYLVVLVVLTGLVLGVGSLLATPDRDTLAVIAGYLFLGGGMFGSLLVVNSQGALRLVVVALAGLAGFALLGGHSMAFLAVAVVVSVLMVWLGARASRQVTTTR